MQTLRVARLAVFALTTLSILLGDYAPGQAQAALLLEEPYGFFGVLVPTGHNAFYFQRICAETPIKLRRCHDGELGTVISRYQGIAHYDWIAIPIIPYLYSVQELGAVPEHVTSKQVDELRNRYHDTYLTELGKNLSPGSFFTGGWTELVGVVYERRVYAYRFQTTEAEDDAVIEQLNSRPNRSHFNLFYSNCADFSRNLLNHYFPGVFKRSFFPDAGMTTPKQITSKLIRNARKHPERKLTIYEIPQIPGLRRASRNNRGVAESLSTTGYVIPIAILNPYLAGGIFANYLIRGRFHVRRNVAVLLPPARLPELAGIQPEESAQVQASAVRASDPAAGEKELSSEPELPASSNYPAREIQP